MSVTLTGDGIGSGGNTVTSSKLTGRLITVDAYDSPGTYSWYRPANCNKVFVMVTGGGGGGAGYCESGGAGGYAEKIVDVTGVSVGSAISVTVGSGGSNVTYYTTGGDGGTSSFGAYVSATGGYGANRNANHTGGVGGDGSGGDVNLRGGTGTGHVNSYGRGSGMGGASKWGQGYGSSHSTQGVVGYATPGAGGVGAVSDAVYTGGPGSAGSVIIYSYE